MQQNFSQESVLTDKSQHDILTANLKEYSRIFGEFQDILRCLNCEKQTSGKF